MSLDVVSSLGVDMAPSRRESTLYKCLKKDYLLDHFLNEIVNFMRPLINKKAKLNFNIIFLQVQGTLQSV